MDSLSSLKEFKYKKWITEKEQRVHEKTKKNIMVTIKLKRIFSLEPKEVVDYFMKELGDILAHEYRIVHQHRFRKQLIENLKPEECFILMDFSENYCCKYSSEIQAIHFGASRNQITLHTGMFYTFDFKQGFATFSASLRHDANAVIAHLEPILSSYFSKFPDIKYVHFMSDSPSNQYRNKRMFWLITQKIPVTHGNIQKITYNFSETGHGKGPADGIGAVVKRALDDSVKYDTGCPKL